MRLIDEQYMRTPFYGWPRMTAHLRHMGYEINHKRVKRLMQKMSLQALYPKHRTTKVDKEHRIYPYLLRGMAINSPNQVWCSDITYVPMSKGFMYLVAIMDWFSRYVLSWEISNSLDSYFCMRCLDRALQSGSPEIFNTDQGAQFTSHLFTSALEGAGIRVSMDGKGRALDNVFIERLWRSVKYEDIYIRDYATGQELTRGLEDYFRFYNHDRVHQGLDYCTPAEVHYGHREETIRSGSAGAARNGCHSGEHTGAYPPYFH
jgi:putative transposase